ncbi:two-component system, chemotaxis family, sensor kinase CheA [Pseudomonas cuatrocienegasensis]|uniref:Chemotaxis protein CheA n=1 Tax=Pseudomonas cuatrocienegasensis TaxID=543360 RepID=A0ABY1BJR7_9PSED|nr:MULTISPECIES: chemotaxis protein CheA [Pseudomonas]OEC35123.1 chemotaxis protein CheA [Pseudomonas sp. 21C1]SER01978.1 two-component system, chemotaxis family, sensor kinase CheA [Pseudomonas cuatrocienegasensis]
MDMDEVLKTFIAESQELLLQMEDALLQLEHTPGDADTINAIFRAAHTIKGSAGLFGLDLIVAFTHIAESVLDRVRSNELQFNAELTALFLQVGDHLARLIALVDAGADLNTLEVEVQATHETLSEQLSYYLAPATAAKPVASQPTRIERGNASGLSADHWHLSLRFGPDTLRNGMDPLGLFRYLNTFGRIVSIVPLLDRLPSAAEMDPETCYLGFEIAFASDADKATIDGTFEFVREDSLIRILPPHSKSDEYLELIRTLPEEDMRLGEILMRCGTLTAAELQEVLLAQVEGQQRDEAQPIGQVLMEQSLVQAPVIAAALQKQQQIKDNRSNENSLIRVDANKLDKLIDLVGELIIAGAGARMTAKNCGHSEMLEATELLSRLVEEVRDSALPLRMVQIGATFNRFQRVVRDVSKEIGKDISLSISGGETELDKSVVERMGDPLTHLVRNAMDHGIESLQTRQANGKPAQGNVCLNACHDGGNIIIEVTDDGGGLDPQRILAKARERGLVSDSQTLTEQEIFNLIFEPGFSTADQVSNLSGRGVGMDVVKRNISALRGTIELSSTLGQGTRVRIRLPLTLAIIDGFLVNVGQAGYVIPLEQVEECIELHSDSAITRGHLELHGQMLPVVRLRELFDDDSTPPRRESVVVVQQGGLRAGLVVDQLVGEFQTVIKPLGKVFAACRVLGGFTILGDGSVALILDIPRLLTQLAAPRSAVPFETKQSYAHE